MISKAVSDADGRSDIASSIGFASGARLRNAADGAFSRSNPKDDPNPTAGGGPALSVVKSEPLAKIGEASDLRGSVGSSGSNAGRPSLKRVIARAGECFDEVSDGELAPREAAFYPLFIVFFAPSDSHEARAMADGESCRPRAGVFDSPRVVGLEVGVSISAQITTLREEIAAGIEMAFREASAKRDNVAGREAPAKLLANLTAREREVLQLILEGFPNKNIASDLGISMRTVEHHRAAIMKKSGCRSLPALVRLALAEGDGFAAPAKPA